MNINRRERLWHGGIGFKGRNSFGVEAPRARIPRVARSSRPWALLRNPFGIKRDRKALRWLRDQKLSPIPAQTPTFRKNRFLKSPRGSQDSAAVVAGVAGRTSSRTRETRWQRGGNPWTGLSHISHARHLETRGVNETGRGFLNSSKCREDVDKRRILIFSAARLASQRNSR